MPCFKNARRNETNCHYRTVPFITEMVAFTTARIRAGQD